MCLRCRYRNQSSGSQHSVLRYRKQVVLMLGTVVLSFFVCLMPFRALTLWIIMGPQEAVLSLETYYIILCFCRVMTYINSAINPILYNLMSSKFRDGFLRLCGLRTKRRLKFHLGRKGTFNTTSTTTTTNCSSMLQDSLWSKSVRTSFPGNGRIRRAHSTNSGDSNGTGNSECLLLRSKSHLACSARNNVVRIGEEQPRRKHDESYV